MCLSLFYKQESLEENLFNFVVEIKSMHNLWAVNSSSFLRNAYVDIICSRCDIASDVCELLYSF